MIKTGYLSVQFIYVINLFVMKINITFRQLEAFVALARTLNFSEAAKNVYLSQPALSAAIRKLEERVDAVLFDRTTRTVILTPIGAELLVVVSRMLDDFDSSLSSISDLVSGKRGSLAISAAPSLAATFLPEVLNAFQQKYPEIALRVHDALSEVSIELLKAGTVELALAPAKFLDEDLVHRELFLDRLVLVCPPDHDLAKYKKVTWTKLQPYRLVSLRSTSNVRILMEAEYLQHGKKFQPSFEVEQTSTLIGFILNKLGVGILPASLIPLVNSGNLATVDLVSPEIHRSICVVRLKARSPSPAAQTFMELCDQYAKKYQR
ncbi:LysR family transcriptional regulator [Paralcaligenes sp. KSB-10]|uniref:LysR family transcriptional regulator n=1 Tax=Paralcaligenes sp. KSB-10 TaxID=2901142 RepID=UPI001E3BC583|nr:LysR family transcriptional regulator [Paralcaligenes sp. KSB-10]UHL65255.1 LysR family transcriptional regulator [Paralcaligenes sp. KSB-10]